MTESLTTTDSLPGQTGPIVRQLLQAEGATVLALSLWSYADLGHGWLLFAALFFVPDVAMLGYLRDKRTGAHSYNLAHTYVASAALIAAGHLFAAPAAIAFGLVWTAHIGFDRLMGYGLKYPRSFHATHLMARE
jgi:hypothetical protein